MSIANFPASLVPIIQRGFLERKMQTGLRSVLGYRQAADRERFPNKIGETITKTRRGLKVPQTEFIDPTTNTGLDNGLTPSAFSVEQYTLRIGMLADTIDLNVVTEGVGIAGQFVANGETNGIQAAQSLDRVAKNTLFNSYLGGNTFVTATLGAPGKALAVDDVRGFENVLSSLPDANGNVQPIPVSVANPMAIVVNGVVHSVTGVTRYTPTAGKTSYNDPANTSSAKLAGGIAGTLTTVVNVTVADGTLGNGVVSSVAPKLVRAGGRASTYKLTNTDFLTMAMIRSAVATLRSNGVPTVGGRYVCALDPQSAYQLFADSEFQLLYRGTGNSSNATIMYDMGVPVDILDVRFVSTTEAYVQAHPVTAGLTVRRPIIYGKGALVEGDYEGIAADDHVQVANAVVNVIDAVAFVTRAPLDRLGQLIAQSWYFMGGFAVPTDITANASIIPTANNAYFKRAVVLEHVTVDG